MHLRITLATLFVCLSPTRLYAQTMQPPTWKTKTAAALDLQQAGKFADAERLLLASLEQAEREEPGPAPAATIYNNLGGVYQDQGLCDLAIRAYQRSIDLWHKAGDPNRHYLLQTSNHLIGVYLQCGDLDDALRHHRALVEPLLTDWPGRDRDPSVAQALSQLGSIQFNQRRFKDARRNYEEALAIEDQSGTQPARERAVLLNNLAFALAQTGEAARAVDIARSSLSLLEATSSNPSDPLLLAGLVNTAVVCLKAGQWPETAPLLDRALDIVHRAGYTESPITTGIFTRFVALLRQNHRKTESAALESRLRDLPPAPSRSNARQTVDLREMSLRK